MTFEEYLKKNVEAGAIDHCLRSTMREFPFGTFPVFYIHADSKGSDTPDFAVIENKLFPIVNGEADGRTQIMMRTWNALVNLRSEELTDSPAPAERKAEG